MRVVITGGAGFIGRAVVKRLVGRGDDVVAIVRDPAHAPSLAGATVVSGDLSSPEELQRRFDAADAVIHLAGMYRVGIMPAERPAMLDANVGATNRVVQASVAAGVARIVYVSTVNAFGNTHGEVVDETFRRNPDDGYVSYYDETKFLAHELVLEWIARGAPVIIVQPGTVYGPHDHSAIGAQLEQAYRGTLRYRAVDDLGIALVHIDDVGDGIVSALDRGRTGEAYVMAGAPTRLRDALEVAATVGRHRLPHLRVPAIALRAMAPLVARVPATVAVRFGLPPNLREVVSAAAGVTYWASSAKAERELAFTARPLDVGLRDAFGTA